MLLVVQSKTANPRPARDDPRLAPIASKLRHREAGFWTRVSVKLATGIPVLLIGPAVGGFIVQGLLFLSKTTWHPGYLACYGIACLILIPILFLIEIQNRGDFYFNEARFYHSPGEAPATSMRYTSGGASDMEVGLAFVEVLLFAPRQILSAISDMKQQTVISDDEQHRAAQIVLALQIADAGVPIAKLLRPDESGQSFARIVRYLQFHDWIGLSKDRERAWLNSDAKKWLDPSR